MPTIEIDGRQIPFDEGETILQAAHRAGIEIPHYCWHPGLSVAAGCRMCLVEVLPPPGHKPTLLNVLRYQPDEHGYQVEQKPKLQPACDVCCTDGMKVLSDTSAHVRKARAAVQELLLLNHPVDCPICDQAGECKLQDYWLEHQRTGKRLRHEPVHKEKAQLLGPTIVYDAERCISCTRCIRFCREIARDPVLDMRGRGNLKELIVAPRRQLDHGYSLMTEHVCPVGALTSSHFRFKARVWFLRSGRTICQECATGCNAYLDYDPRDNRPYRYRPRENPAVNRYWMCDQGMLSYPRAIEGRLLAAHVGGDDATVSEALQAATTQLKGHEHDPERVAVVLSAQHCCEDNLAMLALARECIGTSQLFVTGRAFGEGDEVLRSEDHNPNRLGCQQLAAPHALRPFAELLAELEQDAFDFVLSLGAEHDVDEKAAKQELSRLKGFVVIASNEGPLVTAAHIAIPACAWAETAGTYVGRAGLAQKAEAVLQPRGEAREGWELVAALGEAMGYRRLFPDRAALEAALEAALAEDAVAEAAAAASTEKAARANGASAAQEQA